MIISLKGKQPYNQENTVVNSHTENVVDYFERYLLFPASVLQQQMELF